MTEFKCPYALAICSIFGSEKLSYVWSLVWPISSDKGETLVWGFSAPRAVIVTGVCSHLMRH